MGTLEAVFISRKYKAKTEKPSGFSLIILKMSYKLIYISIFEIKF
jgi:hypothetical protein